MAYSQEFKASALIRLAENRGDFERTANELGCTSRSLRHWANGQRIEKSFSKSSEKKRASEEISLDDLTVSEYLEQAIKHMLSHPPEEMAGGSWGTSLGILFDKWLLIQGQPTERTEHTETVARLIRDLPEDERNYVIRRAEEIVRRASGSLDD